MEGAAILTAVLTVIFTNAINDYQKESEFQTLNAKKDDKKVTVFRSRREQRIDVRDLMVGDIIRLEPGDVVSADCLYLWGYNLTCDESSATGESDAVRKQHDNEGDCFILSGSKVLEGVANCLVIAVGVHSYYGKTMMAMRSTTAGSASCNSQESTPLQLKLDVLAEQIAKFGFGAAITMLLMLVIKYFVMARRMPAFPSSEEIAATLVNIVIQTITIIVVAVPEGLPMAVTMALGFTTTQMLKDNNLVRVMAACETMGNATTICTDKTGTLTQNQMEASKGMLGMETFESIDEIERWQSRVDPDRVVRLIAEGIAVNSTAYEDTSEGEDEKTKFLGSVTEQALLLFARKLGYDYSILRRQADVIKVFPFSSKRKSMSTVIRVNDASAPTMENACTYRIHTKGASEIILKACTHYLDAQGHIRELDQVTRRRWQKLIDEDTSHALRTLALAFRDLPTEHSASGEALPLNKLVLTGIVGIQDPLRPGVVESVAAFRRAGVFVRMITGDNIKTATAIARNAGILTKGGVALNGEDWRAMSPEQQRQTVRRMQVLARCSPVDKRTVVIRLQELDQVVGMTGDGTNDGPALKLADVGFSMGVAGTEVAKEASDIVLMDDNFNSILKALMWGRSVTDSVRKFLTFQLTVNVAAVVISFVSAVASEHTESVLTAVQLLWVNLIMDTLAALALATEPPTPDILNRKPASKYAYLVNYRMVKMILGQSIFQIAISIAAMYAGPSLFGLDENDPYERGVLRTMVFNMFVFLQLFNEINCRRVDDSINVFKNLLHDWIFLAVIAAIAACQVLIVTFGGLAFNTMSLTPGQWLVTVGIGALSLPVGLLIRLISDCFGIEEKFKEDALPLASYSRLHWEGAIGQIRKQLRIYSLLRRTYHTDTSDRLHKHYHGYTHRRPRAFRHPNKNISEPVSEPSEDEASNDSVTSLSISTSGPIHAS